MTPFNDNERPLHELAEYELAEWAQADQEDQRRREAEDRAKLGIGLLVVLITGLMAMGAVYNYGGGLG